MPKPTRKFRKPWKLVCNVEGYLASYSTKEAAEAEADRHRKPGHRPEVIGRQIVRNITRKNG